MIEYKEKIPTPIEYNHLTNAVGWGTREDNVVQIALNNSIYSICAYEGRRMVGYGRIIGDKTIFLYIQDIMVDPNYQNNHVGTNIMKKILEKINELRKINPNIRTYLGTSQGKEEFYKKFGFITRYEANLGEGMILRNTYEIGE